MSTPVPLKPTASISGQSGPSVVGYKFLPERC